MTITLHADPSARRQTGAEPLWIFWRDAPSGTGREAFVAGLHACANPDCPCTEVTLLGVFANERLRSARLGDGELTLDFDAPSGTAADATLQNGAWHTARLDFAQRTVATTSDDPAANAATTAARADATGHRDLATWLRGEFDDELATLLRAMSERAKQATAAAPPDPWDGWEPGDLVRYRDAFPPGDLAALHPDDATFELDDLHCVDPRCDCMDVRLVAMRRAPTSAARAFAGSFVVTLPSLAPRDLETGDRHTTREQLLAVWRRTRDRHPDLAARLAERRARMKTLQPPRRATAAPAAPLRLLPKPGRNDPCPCGSGKKYKKCCGA